MELVGEKKDRKDDVSRLKRLISDWEEKYEHDVNEVKA
jgi:hypothetical protein